MRRVSDARARRAIERQLEYQTDKASTLIGRELEVEAGFVLYTRTIRGRIESHRPFQPTDRMLEVGSGAHGLIFFLGHGGAVGVDPLAGRYARLFPQFQRRAPTVAAHGEALPFADATFDVVLCDNVVDHAADPPRIAREMARVLRPGGLLYFTVHVHHPVFGLASSVYERVLGGRIELSPFADHTYHFTLASVRRMFAELPLATLSEDSGIATRGSTASLPNRILYRNARYELIARRR